MKQGLFIICSIVLILGGCRNDISSQPETDGKKEWQKVGSFGTITTVYMSPEGLADNFYIAKVLRILQTGKSIQQIWFFDDKANTPTGVPMTDSQMLHWRARYSVNRNTGHEEFVFIKIVNPNISPPEILEQSANIRPVPNR